MTTTEQTTKHPLIVVPPGTDVEIDQEALERLYPDRCLQAGVEIFYRDAESQYSIIEGQWPSARALFAYIVDLIDTLRADWEADLDPGQRLAFEIGVQDRGDVKNHGYITWVAGSTAEGE